MDKQTPKLPEEVAKKYEMPAGAPFRCLHKKYGEIDLTRISPAQAEKLAKAEDFNHLVVKKSEAEPKKTAAK